MVIWGALFIPVIASIWMFLQHRDKFTWWELILPLIVCLLFVSIFKATVEQVRITDTEYNGGIIISARYVEPYTTWVKKTCTRSYKCGKSTCFTTYDCSYCDRHSARYYVTDNRGLTWDISKDKYYELSKQWSCSPKFIELNRNIVYHYGCGADGNAYDIYWDHKYNTSESSVTTKRYENRVQASHSAFSFEEVSEDMADSLGLFKYSELNNYRQQCVFGIDNIYSVAEARQIHTNFEFINGYYKIKIFLLVFHDKSRDIADHQQAYFDGGNDNELIVCMSINPKTKEIQWVKPFSWSPNRRCIVECRENISELKTFDPDAIYNIVSDVAKNHFKPKDFKEFSYLTVDPPRWEIIITYIITLIITGWINWWALTNEYE